MDLTMDRLVMSRFTERTQVGGRPQPRQQVCWNLALKLSRFVSYSPTDVYMLACRAWDATAGDPEATETVTAMICRAASLQNCSLWLIEMKPVLKAYEEFPHPLELLEQRLRGYLHPDGCECLGCAWDRLRAALRALGREILKSIGWNR